MTANTQIQTAEQCFEQGVAEHQQGLISQAEAAYRKAIELDPAHAAALNNLGVLLEGRGESNQAEALYRAALSSNPTYADALNNLGLLLAASGRAADAEAVYAHAIDNHFADSTTYRQCGNLLASIGLLDTAEASLRHALTLGGDPYPTLLDLSSVLARQQRPAEAAQRLLEALARRPASPVAHARLGALLQSMQRLDEAEAHLRESLRIEPNQPETLCDLAALFQNTGRHADAEACLHQAASLAPGHLRAHGSLGNLYLAAARYAEAEASFRRALAIDASSVEALNNLARVLESTHRSKEAEENYRRVLEIDPSRVPTQLNLSMSMLRDGRFEEAWPLYESRYAESSFWGDEAALRVKPQLPAQEWQGESLKDRSLLVWPEQGYGDSLQFARYFPLLKAKGLKQLTVVCPRALVSLFERIEGVDTCLPLEDARDLPKHDFWCFTMSVPLQMGTTLANVPASVPYLTASAERIAHWEARVPEAPLNVGLVWAGDPRPQLNSAHETDQRRSLHARAFLPLLNTPGVRFVSLQKGASTQPQIDELPPAVRPLDLMHEVESFADTAAIITQLDLIITVDTSVAHLAAAMGKPVWMLSRYDGCWRWLNDRDDSPWYPTMRLFRQVRPGDWDEVIGRVQKALTERADAAPVQAAVQTKRKGPSKSGASGKKKS
ncbi:tetratricopeptide repeat protein [Caballeronia sp. BR00000012568055]|uniref:tetratricopeptide repeat protein n=1 Tax=Caballeronia sp. BR00000012568055 TaxID=2918761 RepID=UPI0023F75332|nr:tetratricopeptide repeat protein [Caballeronia sp. BR00000012568055]